jgi:diguanylate cyclase (GGDEF)-like protein
VFGLTLIAKLNEDVKNSLIMSYIDNLTGLQNHKGYTDNISKQLNIYRRYKTPFSIIMYDIDNFKEINDTYGHSVGDDVLIEMSKLIKSHIRESDYIFRTGGEEFVILLTETQLDKAQLVAEKIRGSVESDLKTIEDGKITISVGVTEVKQDDTESTIYKRVDELLYKSKNSGKNKVTSSNSI